MTSSRNTISICFFNNKGGVGKTTLACNIAGLVAEHYGKKVLLVDADPQCNATQLILADELTSALYSESTGQRYSTLLDVLAPLSAGDSTISTPTRVADAETNRFKVALLPGHPKVALLEDKLSQNWASFLGSDLGGARMNNWNAQLLRHFKGDYDLIIFDVGPSLGALNRSVLIGADYFVAPMGCDIFSLIGIDNIGDWLAGWQEQYVDAYSRTKKAHSATIDKYIIRSDFPSICRFLGYTVQQYVTKTIRGTRRPTVAYEQIMANIPEKIVSSLAGITAPNLTGKNLRLGDVPHMFSLVPLAQSAHAPIHGLERRDGLSGGQFQQQADYKSLVKRLADSLLRNIAATHGGALHD